jgi:hypothetical protein
MWTLWESRVLCEISEPLWARSVRPQGGSAHIVFDAAKSFKIKARSRGALTLKMRWT